MRFVSLSLHVSRRRFVWVWVGYGWARTTHGYAAGSQLLCVGGETEEHALQQPCSRIYILLAPLVATRNIFFAVMCTVMGGVE